MRENRLGMNIGSVLPFLYVDSSRVERDCIHLPEFRTTEASKVFVAAQIRILCRKAVPMNRCPGRATNGLNERKAR